jgi:hypothetical protein
VFTPPSDPRLQSEPPEAIARNQHARLTLYRPFASITGRMTPSQADQEPAMPASKPQPNQHPNRESWLNDVADRLRPAFAQLGAPLPDRLRIAIGFPSTGRRAKARGECWDSTASADDTFEIFIRPDLAEADGGMAMLVAAALAHELVHAAVGIKAGRGPEFRKVALGIGLIGPMRATGPGPAFLALAAPIIDAVGPLPHARLLVDKSHADANPQDEDAPLTTSPRKQASRHVKCTCPACGYIARTSRSWIDQAGPPHCPLHGPMQTDSNNAPATPAKQPRRQPGNGAVDPAAPGDLFAHLSSTPDMPRQNL